MLFLIIISVILLTSTPLCHLPQFARILVLRSSDGIPLLSSLLLALTCQTQLVAMYYSFACHLEYTDGSVIAHPPNMQNALDLAQIVVQWICSLLQLVLVAALRTSPESSPDRLVTSMTGPKTALFCILVHAAVSIFLAVIAGRPTDDWDWIDRLIFGIMFFANNYIAIPLSTLAICVAFAYQARESSSCTRVSAGGTSRAGSRGALSTRALALQGIVSLALAVAWPWRFGFPRNLSEGGWWVVTVWYPLVGWACVNGFVAAVGQFSVLYVVTSAGSDGGAGRMEGERWALLG